MRLLPLVERELRVAARQRRTFYARFIFAFLAFLLLCWLLHIFRDQASVGNRLFYPLAISVFFYCLLSGVLRTADTISAERRDNTLGFLFLTNLRGHDVVLGKLFGAGIHVFYGFFAIIPILMIPALVGGVTLIEVSRSALALVSTLFLSISVGILVSSLFLRGLIAITVGILLLLTIAFAPLIIGESSRFIFGMILFTQIIPSISPFYALMMAEESARILNHNFYWASILIINLMSFLSLLIAVRIVPRLWQDNPGTVRRLRWGERFKALRLGSLEGRKRFRQKWADYNPIYWLEGRQQVSSGWFLFLSPVVASLAILIGTGVMGRIAGGRNAPLEGLLITWGMATALMHVAVIYLVGLKTGQRFSEDRKSGALELLLSTTLPVRDIVRGQWLANFRQFLPPVICVIFFHLLFAAGVMAVFRISGESWLTPLAVLRVIFENFKNPVIPGPNWEIGLIFLLIASVLAGVIAALFSMMWVGMWMGLKMRHPMQAPLLTWNLVVAVPWPVFILIIYLMNKSGFRFPHNNVEVHFYLLTAMTLTLGNSLFWGIKARRAVYRDFRSLASERFMRADKKWFPGVDLPRIRRISLRLAAAFFLLFLLYRFELWRGKRHWERTQKQSASIFISPNQLPSAVPPEDNLLSFQFAEWKKQNATAAKNSVAGWMRNYPRYNLPSASECYPWIKSNATLWEKWRRSFVDQRLISTNAAETNNVSFVLGVLERFEPDLIEFRKTLDRPFTIAKTECLHRHIETTVPDQENAAEILSLRACALLETGRLNEAVREIESLLLLTKGLGRDGRLLQAQVHCLFLTLQPIWEGIAAHRFTEDQLTRFENALAALNLRKTYEHSIHELVRATIDWEQGVANGYSQTLVRGQKLLLSLYPDGWIYQKMASTMALYESHLKPWSASTNQFYLANEYPDLLQKVHSQAGGSVTALFTPNHLKTLSEAVASETFIFTMAYGMTELARTACALEKFYAVHHAYPENLHELAPRFTPPLDPVTGLPFNYRRRSSRSYQLYSIGINNRDNGGAAYSYIPRYFYSYERQFHSDMDWVWAVPENRQ
ncbi:MAG: ABC transporter permease [Verrucomicrobiota bacterium]|nr:ABC transporter permease [Verrucomicrobiota bacterium]